MLTKKLVELACEVVAVDSCAAQVEASRSIGIEARVGDGEALEFENEFDAVFSNAVLHWIKRADLALSGVYRALRPQGRFVAEFGGAGCVQAIRSALVRALDARGIDGQARIGGSKLSADRSRARWPWRRVRPTCTMCRPNSRPNFAMRTAHGLPIT